MKCLRLFFLAPLASLAPLVMAQEVGQGAPPGVDARFVNAFFRNRFNALVSVPPVGPVRRFGPTGWVQEFRDANRDAANLFALVKADSNLALPDGGIDTFQVYPAIYRYLTTLGVADTGYPIMDTALCSQSASGAAGSVCSYQIFNKNHALFSFSSSILRADATANYAVKNAMFTRWTALGGVTALGPPAGNEATITAASGTTAVQQTFTAGAIYSITSGAFSGRTFAVQGKVFDLYLTLGLHGGSLGLPLSEELNAGSGRFRQNFEGGSIEYTATTDAILRPAVGGVSLDVSTAAVVRMNLGDTLALRAIVLATVGGQLTDREVSWVTTNGRVVTIQSNGVNATVRAVSGGTAQVIAVSEGKASAPLNVFVVAPCCQVGEGAPTAAIQQSFQDAVTRSRLSIQLPLANPVQRVGLGYVQELLTIDGARLLLCRSDRSPGVFLVGGEILRAWEAEGGAAGRLGYPVAEETATGRQSFEGGALAGQPVVAVLGNLLRRWEELGFERGALGNPTAGARNVLSFTGATASAQSFTGGLLVEIRTGRFASARPLLVTGPFLSEYAAAGSVEGNLGLPISEAYRSPQGLLVQDFEGGQVRIRDDGTPQAVERERSPEVTASPSRVTAGGRVRIIAGGFAPGATLLVSFPGQSGVSGFDIATAQGAYTWETPVPANARSGSVSILVREAGSNRQATTSYSIVALNEQPITVSRIAGDTQTGLPGARLPVPLTIAVRDSQGAPLIGIPVQFTASPGSVVVSSDAATNERGEAAAIVRLQDRDGIVLVTAEAAGRIVTFSARSAGASLVNYPRQTRAQGAMLAAVSSILRYHQGRNELPAALGLSDPALLDSFLKGVCLLDTSGGRFCDGYLTPVSPSEPLVNLWRLRDFVGGNLDVVPLVPGTAAILDTLAAGAPVLLALRTPVVAGTHFVAAIGVSASGEILVHDPEPASNRQRLADFLVGGGAVLDAIRLVPRSPSPTPFLLAGANSEIAVRGENGDCGKALVWPARAGGSSVLYACAGLERAYALDIEGEGPVLAWLTDLGAPGRRTEISGGGLRSFLAVRPDGQWAPQEIEAALSSEGVRNAATQTTDLAPGALAVVRGVGLAAKGKLTTATVGGLAAAVQQAGEFRLQIVIPPATPPGEQILQIETPFGPLTVPILVREVAPAIFVDERTGAPAIFNGAGTERNSAAAPVSRGGTLSVYATGLGAVRPMGNNQVVVQPVTVMLQGKGLSPSFAGLAPGLPGVYVINVPIPAALAPGLDITLSLTQAGILSNGVPVSIR